MIKAFPCEVLSWEDMYEYARVLSGKIREDKFRPDAIVAIARGGYVPARSLADFLMVSELYSLQVSHWGMTAEKSDSAQIKEPLNADIAKKNVLLVDDLSDTGQSFSLARDHLLKQKPKKLKTAALFVLENSSFVPDYYASKQPWKWFVFPWNFTEDLCQLVAGLYEPDSDEKKSLDMVKEELYAKHQIRVPSPKIKPVMDELVHRRILTPYWKSGGLVRWMPFKKKISGSSAKTRPR